MKKHEKDEVIAQIRRRYEAVKDTLTERGRRLFAAGEAKTAGYGGTAAAAEATGLSRNTVRRGVRELEAHAAGDSEAPPAGRVRRQGGGRKKIEDKYPELLDELRALVGGTTRGDPEAVLQWTSRSLRNLQKALAGKGYKVSPPTISRLLEQLGYSLQANRKKSEGERHPDRDAQFEQLSELCRRQLERGDPVVSVGTKKKELVGRYRNAGRELRPSQGPEDADVDVYDFIGEQGKAVPDDVYDLGRNEAWVSVGMNHDTSEFSVQALRTWWHEMGKARYPSPASLLVTADCGGSNGDRVRLWKFQLQKLVDELGFPITVCHFPSGTSKWNKVEHRLFSFITKNWRGKPLVSHKVVVELISAATTNAGLSVRASIDRGEYKKGIRITDKQMAEVVLAPDPLHGEWNYTIHPTNSDAEVIFIP